MEQVKKRIPAVLLAGLMAVAVAFAIGAVTSEDAYAADLSDIQICGREADTSGTFIVPGATGSASIREDNGALVLTLEDFHCEDSTGDLIFCSCDSSLLTIQLVGENSLTNLYSVGFGIAGGENNSITISGNGSLIVSSKESGIRLDNKLTIEGNASVTVKCSNSTGTAVNADAVSVDAGSTLIARGGVYGIDVRSSLVIEEGAVVAATADERGISCSSSTEKNICGIIFAGVSQNTIAISDNLRFDWPYVYVGPDCELFNDGYLPWMKEDELPSMTDWTKYFLTDHVTLSGTWSVPAKANYSIWLNGKKIECDEDGPAIEIKNSGSLYVFDETGTGMITHTSGKYGCGVKVNEAAIFRMNGGSITNNAIPEGTKKGGGVYVSELGFFLIEGAVTISGNTRGTGETAIDDNVYLPGSKVIMITGKLRLPAGAKTPQIGVTKDDFSRFTSDLPANLPNGKTAADLFFSDDPRYSVINDPDNGEARLTDGKGMIGAGTQEDPYQITTYEELKEFATIVNGTDSTESRLDACAKLINDITCNDKKWVPIGNKADEYHDPLFENEFSGHFDGNHKVICNLSNEETGTDSDYEGLFGSLTTEGEVKNVGIVDGKILGRNYIGGVAGDNYKGAVSNCYYTGVVSGSDCVGGVAGDNYNIITNCYNIGKVSGSNCVGGVIGISTGSLVNCYNAGEVSGNEYVGGVSGSIVPYNDRKADIINCYNTGLVSGNKRVGNVAGRWANQTMTNCYCDETLGLAAETIGAFGGKEENKDTVKGLTTYQMTGNTALSSDNMDFHYADGEENPWLVKAGGWDEESGTYYWYYPHLKGFDFDSSGQQLSAEEIAAKDWPAKVVVSVNWNAAVSYTYNASAQRPTVSGLIVSQESIEIPKGATNVTYYKKNNEGSWEEIGSAVPTAPGSYRVSFSKDDDSEVTKTFLLPEPTEDCIITYQVQTQTESGDTEWSAIDPANIVNAGKYKAVATLTDGSSLGEKEFQISKAKVNVTAANQSIREGESIAAGTDKATLSGAVEGHSISAVTISEQDGKIMPSDAVIQDAGGVDVTKNYEISYKPGTLTIIHKDDSMTPSDETADGVGVDTTITVVDAAKIRTWGNVKKKTMKIMFPTKAKVTNYRIQYRLAGKTKWTGKWSAGTNTYTIRNLKRYSLCQFRIAGYVHQKDGTWKRGKWSKISYRYINAITLKPLKAGKKKITVTWKKDQKATGYQIVYSLKSDMSKAKKITIKGKSKTKYTIKKLKSGKKYYVQIRPLKKKSGKTYLGILTKAKSTRVK